MGKELLKQMAGKRFGRLLVIERAGSHPRQRCAMWLCRCDCGNERVQTGVSLRCGHVMSCGCLQKEAVARVGAKNAKVRDIDALIKMYEDGSTREEVAARYRLAPYTVDSLLRARGIQPRNRPMRMRPGRFLTEAEKRGILEMYEGKELTTNIAKRFNVGLATVAYTVRDLGGTVRPLGRQWVGNKRIDVNGYITMSLSPEDEWRPMCKPNGQVLEHRLVMAKKLGRLLFPSETVHHKNGIRDDNRPENLQLRQGAHGRGVVLHCLDCGSRNVAAKEI